jgi:FAD/FMN-containing dehydrogenase
MGEPFRKETLAGWGRMAPEECLAYRPEQVRALSSILNERAQPDYIARGLGRSYGDVSVNGGGAVINMTRLNRMLDFDPETAVLECEAGVSLAEIIEVFLPRGYFLPVTPGTKFVTVGGAIANDVHGKNHHGEGSFGNYVQELRLLTPGGEVVTCSPTAHGDLFWATVGGIGLTGIILSARVALQRVASAYIAVDYHRAPDLEDVLSTMAATDDQYQYSVAWVDCLAKGKSLGRSVLMRGRHASPDQLPPGQRSAPFSVAPKRKKGVPMDFPGFVLNPLSIKAFNTAFYAWHSDQQGVIIDYDSYFYPLDGIHHWNRMYGKAGFVQYQATLPPEGVKGLVTVLERLSASRRTSFLAVLKCFGAGNLGLLSHPMKGYTLALDIPNRTGLIPFLHELDRVLLDHGGRLYLAKDSATEPETLAAMYPQLARFQEIIGRLDPEQCLSSTMARRLGIVPPRRRAASL